jgi:spermidine/putrescine transport system substrate-binding protein
MKRLHLITIVCALILSVWQVPGFANEAKIKAKELVILTWAEYIDPAVLTAFERKQGVKIRVVHFTGDDQRDELLVATDGAGYDLVVVNETQVPFYRDHGWLLPLTAREVPNLKYIEPTWLEKFAEAKDYAVPYFWGTTGIGYRRDLVAVAPRSWMDLLKPVEALRGRLAMPGSQGETLGIALKALGYSINSTDSHEVEQAISLLLEQKPFVRSEFPTVLNKNSELVKGDVSMSMTYSCDALTLRTYNDKIEYVVPSEGGLLWVDYFVVLAKSQQAKLGYAFLDFINEPARAAKLAEFNSCSTPNEGARKLLPAAYHADPIRSPSADTLANSELIVKLPARALRERNNQLARLRH